MQHGLKFKLLVGGPLTHSDEPIPALLWFGSKAGPPSAGPADAARGDLPPSRQGQNGCCGHDDDANDDDSPVPTNKTLQTAERLKASCLCRYVCFVMMNPVVCLGGLTASVQQERPGGPLEGSGGVVRQFGFNNVHLATNVMT